MTQNNWKNLLQTAKQAVSTILYDNRKLWCDLKIYGMNFLTPQFKSVKNNTKG